MQFFDFAIGLHGRWDRIGAAMRRRLLAFLLLVGGACVVGYGTFLVVVVERDALGSLIGTMGRQRMLSQRIALTVTELRDGMADAAALANQVTADLRAMEAGFASLDAARAGGLVLESTAADTAAMAALRADYAAFRRDALAAAELVETPHPTGVVEAGRRVAAAVAGPLTAGLERIVADLEAVSERRYAWIRRYSLGAALGFLVFLVVLGHRLLWPLSHDVERAVMRLAKLESFQRGVVDRLPAGLLVLDAAGQRIVQMNEAAEAIFGWPRDTQPPLDAVMGGGWSLDRLRVCHRLRASGTRRDGAELHLEVSAREAADHWLLIVKDITEEVEAKADIAALYKVLETIPVSVAITDTEGRIEFVNARFGEMTGYPASEAVGHTPSLLKSGRTADSTYDTLWRTVTRGDQWRGELLNRRKDGNLFWEYEVITPLRDSRGRVVRFFVIGEDVTHLKKTEERLRAALDAAEEANRVKSNFLASMSHELRTPLNAVIGYSELMSMGIDGPLTDRYHGYVSDIRRSGEHLLALINNLLDLSKIEAGQMELNEEEAEVPTIVDAAAAMVQERADRAAVRVCKSVAGDLPAVRVDSLRMRQVLINLLTNAIKYSEPGGTVTVTAAADADGLALIVADRGAGIAEEDMERVLKPFGQARSALVREKEGTGLGLPICKQFVELHGGTLALESRLGHGTRVTVRLPAARLVARRAAVPLAPGS